MSKIRKLQMKKSNPNLVTLIDELLKAAAEKKAPVWKFVAEKLSAPRRMQVVVNVSKIERYAKQGEFVLVPGKVLGSGKITKSVKVAALNFSETARQKVLEAGGECLNIKELMSLNPEGSNVRILV